MSQQLALDRRRALKSNLEYGYVPARYRTPEFIAMRNEWYRKLEGEGVEVSEMGFQPKRQRSVKGPAIGDAEHYEVPQFEPGADMESAERVNARHFGGPRSTWSLETAEFWRLMSNEVAKLPECYRGKAFLARWADIGDVKTAAAEVGLSRWKARNQVEKFKALLRQKRVLR